jgi:hypothetical protein
MKSIPVAKMWKAKGYRYITSNGKYNRLFKDKKSAMDELKSSKDAIDYYRKFEKEHGLPPYWGGRPKMSKIKKL